MNQWMVPLESNPKLLWTLIHYRTEVRTCSFSYFIRVASNLGYLSNFLEFCDVKGYIRILVSNNELQPYYIGWKIMECSFCFLCFDEDWGLVFKTYALLELSRHSNYSFIESLPRCFPNKCVWPPWKTAHGCSKPASCLDSAIALFKLTKCACDLWPFSYKEGCINWNQSQLWTS